VAQEAGRAQGRPSHQGIAVALESAAEELEVRLLAGVLGGLDARRRHRQGPDLGTLVIAGQGGEHLPHRLGGKRPEFGERRILAGSGPVKREEPEEAAGMVERRRGQEGVDLPGRRRPGGRQRHRR
jgi:hypothetical protein